VGLVNFRLSAAGHDCGARYRPELPGLCSAKHFPAGRRQVHHLLRRFVLVHGLSPAYRRIAGSYVPANENDMAYNSDLRFCSTVGDRLQLWRGVKDKNLIRPETFRLMSTAEGAAAQMSAQDPQAQYGFAMILNHEDAHRRIGQHGSLLGFSGSLYDFPAGPAHDCCSYHTEGQNAYAITRALSRAILGLPALASTTPAVEPILADKPVTNAERKQIGGTFVLKLDRVLCRVARLFAQYRTDLSRVR